MHTHSDYVRVHICICNPVLYLHPYITYDFTLFQNAKVGGPLLHHRGSGVADHLLDGDLVHDFVGQHLADQEDGRDTAAAWSMIKIET